MFLDLENLSKALVFHIYEIKKIVIIYKNKDFILISF